MAQKLIESRYLRKSLSNHYLTTKQTDGHKQQQQQTQTFRIYQGKSLNETTTTTINSNDGKSWTEKESGFQS